MAFYRKSVLVRVYIHFMFFIGVMGLSQCSSPGEPTSSPCLKTVEKLTDRRQQWIFLDSIGKLDQKVRQDEIDALQKYGYDSEEHKQAMARMVQTDASNLECIEAYLAIHGHPTHEKHGIDASSVPGLVIHHSPEGLDSRLRNFKYLYSGYLNRGVFEDDLIMILNRAYQIKYDERITWNRPYRSDEELDTLIRSLGLHDEAERIRRGMNDIE